ncbi:MAG: hypothetical protein LUQ35_02175 [Methanoregula sp.]|jgi:hypothetical protein|nr:hypothetical protein [Methanoregula sp.]
MAGEKRGSGRRRSRTIGEPGQDLQGDCRCNDFGTETTSGNESPPIAFFRAHALSLVIFLTAFFFIVTITSPGLYITDEWITTNQIHQLDLGHQVVFSEGKYGVIENGSVPGYFTARQNVLMYSLALPLTALPFVRMFGLMGDNFRMLIILAWSLSLVVIALLLDTFYPEYAKVFGTRMLFPAVLFALLLFMGNILLYKQFPFTAPDAPFEVAALVLANHIFFSLTVAIIFEIFQAIRQDVWLSLFGTISCVSCSSFLFWAGTGKDHMLTATVFACIIFFIILSVTQERLRYSWLTFIFCGLLIWVRPEVGFFVTLFTGALYGIPLVLRFFRREFPAGHLAGALLPMAGAFIGGIPFFLNNLLTTRNLLIPAFDLPRPLIESATSLKGPLPLQEVTTPLDMVNQTGSLGAGETLIRVYEIISYAIFRSFSFDNLVQGFSGVMFFPANGNIGFAIMCPLVVIALVAIILWHKKVLDVPEKDRNLYLIFLILGFAAIFSYLPKLGAMNLSLGILPDMRYLSPAYIPFGILSVLILSRTPVLKNPRQMLADILLAGLFITPVLFLLMIVVHPFGAVNEGYILFFKVAVIAELVLAVALMTLKRYIMPKSPHLYRFLPWSLILLVITVFTFQLVLVFIFGVIVKANGYPLWIPLMREGFRTFFSVTVLPPV